MPAVELDRVSKSFRHSGGARLLREHVQVSLKGKRPHLFHALRDVSFQLESGESVAVVGSNGAGKSTLLSLVAGLAEPSSGKVRIDGNVCALMQIGSGFHPDLTGRENVFLDAAMLGMSRREAERKYDSIVEFSELADFMENPLRTYSAGMTLRLAFSVAVHVDPDVLILDEVLGVGDHVFAAKCFERILELRGWGKTMIVASHVADTLRSLCDKALWLDHGQVVAFGNANEVLDAYFGGVVAPQR